MRHFRSKASIFRDGRKMSLGKPRVSDVMRSIRRHARLPDAIGVTCGNSMSASSRSDKIEFS